MRAAHLEWERCRRGGRKSRQNRPETSGLPRERRGLATCKTTIASGSSDWRVQRPYQSAAARIYVLRLSFACDGGVQWNAHKQSCALARGGFQLEIPADQGHPLPNAGEAHAAALGAHQLVSQLKSGAVVFDDDARLVHTPFEDHRHV